MYEGINDYKLDSCSYCGSKEIRKAGMLPSGYQRYHCRACGKKFSVLTNVKFFHTTGEKCPHCGSYHNRLAGRLKSGVQRWMCHTCGKTFSEATTIREKVTARCPACNSQNVIRDGKRSGYQKYLCRDCNKSFVPYGAKEKKAEELESIYSDLEKGMRMHELLLKYKKSKDTIKERIREYGTEKHKNKVIKNLPEKVKNEVIFFGLGARVSATDISRYFHIERDVVYKILNSYKGVK